MTKIRYNTQNELSQQINIENNYKINKQVYDLHLIRYAPENGCTNVHQNNQYQLYFFHRHDKKISGIAHTVYIVILIVPISSYIKSITERTLTTEREANSDSLQYSLLTRSFTTSHYLARLATIGCQSSILYNVVSDWLELHE